LRSVALAPPGVAAGLAAPKPVVLKAPSAAEIGALQARASKRGMAPVGMHREVAWTAKIGQWTALKDKRRIWRLAIQAETAVAVRLHFTEFDVGAGRVWIRSLDNRELFGPYTGKGPGGAGEFWADTVLRPVVAIEYLPATGEANGMPPFAIRQISHLFRSPVGE
jgi:hypothetical protein